MASTACLNAPSTAASSNSLHAIPNFRPTHPPHRQSPQPSLFGDETAIAAAGSVSRRLALTVLLGASAAISNVSPADAAYGEAANVFGKPKTDTAYLTYNGNEFKLSIPSKWNPSKEAEFPGQVVQYEDHFDSNSNVTVIVTSANKNSIIDFGSPQQFLSQGGFDPNVVATANILETSTPVIGRKHYSISVLTRMTDGNEGGKHQLITAAVSDGKLHICKVRAGDKRWFRGARKFVEGTASSFNLA